MLVAWLAPSVSAQVGTCTHRILPVTVQDEKGRPVTGLAAADFEGKFRGLPVKLLSIAPDQRPHRIVILLDASGSMHDIWGRVLAPAFNLAGTRLADTQMALLIFNEKIIEQIGFDGGQQAVAARLRELESDVKSASKLVRGRTALSDALVAGLQLLDNPTSADILYLVSDGGDNASHAHFDEVGRRLTSSGVRLFVSAVFNELEARGRSPEEIYGPEELIRLAKITGGEVISPYARGVPISRKDREQFVARVFEFHASMIEDYLLEAEFPESLDKHRTWELKLSKQKREQWKNATILYPTELPACQP